MEDKKQILHYMNLKILNPRQSIFSKESRFRCHVFKEFALSCILYGACVPKLLNVFQDLFRNRKPAFGAMNSYKAVIMKYISSNVARK